ncbi:hypothetical protein ACJJTC_002874 [Scirpophaga incertulas]
MTYKCVLTYVGINESVMNALYSEDVECFVQSVNETSLNCHRDVSCFNNNDATLWKLKRKKAFSITINTSKFFSQMFTISGYTFHPLAARFLNLWRCTRVVSDVLAFVLSAFCCQCWALLPSPTSSEDDQLSIEAFKIMSGPVDVSRAGEPLEPEPLATPQPDKEVEDLEFLERTYKNPEDIQMHEVVGHKPSEELLSVAVHRARPSLEQGDHYPSLLNHTKDEGADDTRPVIPIAATRLEINN